MTEEKGFAFLVPLVIIIVLAILGIGAFLTYQKSKEFSGRENELTKQAQNIPSQAQITDIQNIEPKDLEKLCIDSGGKIVTIDCYCPGTPDFYNTCAIGGCACTPDPVFKRQIRICECSQDNCFNGSKCVKITNN